MNLEFPAEADSYGRKSAIQDAFAAVESASGVLVDWDGCIAIGDRPSHWAVQLIEKYRSKIAIVSNNSTHLPEDFAQILANAGVEFPPERIMLAGVEALQRAAERKPRGALILGDGRLKGYARNLGIPIVQDNADLVILLRDIRFSYSRLERAINCLRAGARLIVANPDVSHPGRDGRFVPETGTLYAAIMAGVGAINIDVEMIGKPEPRLFSRACHALGVTAKEAVMIGDNPATDIAGAEALGMRSILVGEHSGISLRGLLSWRPEQPGRQSRRRTLADGAAS